MGLFFRTAYCCRSLPDNLASHRICHADFRSVGLKAQSYTTLSLPRSLKSSFGTYTKLDSKEDDPPSDPEVAAAAGTTFSQRVAQTPPPSPSATTPKSSSSNSSSNKRLKATQLPPRPTLPSQDLKHSYLKGSGPGGQKINKTSSAVQITHLPTGIVVKSQATRSRSQNHTIAKRILAEKVEFLERGQESRVAKKVEIARKKKQSKMKKSRRKYRELEEEKGKGKRGDEEEEE